MNSEIEANLETEILTETKQPFYQRPVFWAVLLLFLSAFVLRLMLSNVIQGHPTDIINFKAWSMHAAKHSFGEFYKSVNPKVGIWADYPPLYILVLWLVGKLYMLFDPALAFWNGALFTLLVKLPAILADLGCMAFMIVLLRRFMPFSLAYFAALIFALHCSLIRM